MLSHVSSYRSYTPPPFVLPDHHQGVEIDLKFQLLYSGTYSNCFEHLDVDLLPILCKTSTLVCPIL